MACSFKTVVEDGSGAGKHLYQGVVALAAMPHEHALPDGVSAVAPEIRNGNIIKDAGSHTLLTVKE